MARYRLSKVFMLFKKFGSFRLFRAYARIGVLGMVLRESLKGLLRRRPIEEIYYAYQPRIVSAIRNKYQPLIMERLAFYEKESLPHERADVVWFCWLQGIEQAPQMVKHCLASLKKNLPGREIIVIDEQNRRQYATLPAHIEEKWKKKLIPPALFSDLLRLELLIEHGGTWIDSTVLCTGSNYLPASLDTDLFFYQFKSSADARYAGISNWFITACRNNPLLLALRDGLFAYWKDFDCVLEYFVFHRLFDLIAVGRPEAISAMPYAYSPDALALGHNWEKPFDAASWERLVSRVAFHKLTYKVKEEVEKADGNYYHYILEKI